MPLARRFFCAIFTIVFFQCCPNPLRLALASALFTGASCSARLLSPLDPLSHQSIQSIGGLPAVHPASAESASRISGALYGHRQTMRCSARCLSAGRRVRLYTSRSSSFLSPGARNPRQKAATVFLSAGCVSGSRPGVVEYKGPSMFLPRHVCRPGAWIRTTPLSLLSSRVTAEGRAGRSHPRAATSCLSREENQSRGLPTGSPSLMFQAPGPLYGDRPFSRCLTAFAGAFRHQSLSNLAGRPKIVDQAGGDGGGLMVESWMAGGGGPTSGACSVSTRVQYRYLTLLSAKREGKTL